MRKVYSVAVAQYRVVLGARNEVTLSVSITVTRANYKSTLIWLEQKQVQLNPTTIILGIVYISLDKAPDRFNRRQN